MAVEPLDPAPALHGAGATATRDAAISALVRVQLVPIDAIRVPATRLRSRAEVDGLRESIAANGLLQPVVVDGSMTLVCGLHRLEACRALGWHEVPVVVRHEWTSPEARLAEIDENLCRRELNVLERAEHIAQRKKLWDELRAVRAANETQAESPGKKPKKVKAPGKKAQLEELAVFVDDTAKRTGRATAAVREEIRIGELPEEVRSLARETPLVNNRRELLALTRMDEDEQREALERVKAGEAKSVRARSRAASDAPPPADLSVFTDAVLQVPVDEAGAPADGAGDPAAAAHGTTAEALREALETARRALEQAAALWPDEGAAAGDSEPSGAEILRDALVAVRRLADAVRLNTR